MKKIILFIGLILFTIVNAEQISVTYENCVDGDTAWFKYEGKSRKFRFIAINAPEIEHEDNEEEYKGNESKEYVCKLLKNAKDIKIEFDNRSKKQDKYNRYLAWVYVDNELLQEELVKRGLAKVDYVYDEYKYVNSLCKYEMEAIKDKKGIWLKDKNIGYCKNYKIDEYDNVDYDDYNLIVFSFIFIFIVVVVLIIITVIVLNKKS